MPAIDSSAPQTPATSPLLVQTVEWLLASGVQAADGGYFAWNDLKSGKFCYPYPEITGYGISTLCFLNSAFPDPRWIERAHRAANWLCQKALTPQGGIRTRFYFQPNASRPAELHRLYAFDAGIVGSGLLNLFEVTRTSTYLEAAKKIYSFLVKELLQEDGSFSPYFDLEKGTRGKDSTRWSGMTGGYSAKLAIFLLQLSDAGVPEAQHLAENLLDITASRCQKGKFEGNRTNDTICLHPHAYTLEGLLFGLVKLKKPAYVEALAEGYGWLKKALVAQSDISFEGNDVIAQTLRLALGLKSLGVSVEREWTELLHRQLMAGKIESGSHAGAWRYRIQGEGSDHVNTWVTLFALQALAFTDGDRFSRQMQSLSCFI